MMADMHLRNLKQKMVIEKKMDETTKKIESTKVRLSSCTGDCNF